MTAESGRIGPSIPTVATIVFSSLIAGIVIGAAWELLPNRLRIFWLTAAAVGVLSGWMVNRVCELFSARCMTSLLVVSALLASSASCWIAFDRSAARFAAIEQNESDQSRMARQVLKNIVDDTAVDVTQDSTERWMIWRCRPLGLLDARQARFVTLSEGVLCLLAAAAAGYSFRPKCQQSGSNVSDAVAGDSANRP